MIGHGNVAREIDVVWGHAIRRWGTGIVLMQNCLFCHDRAGNSSGCVHEGPFAPKSGNPGRGGTG